MKLIDPKVELFSELNITPDSHLARCSRICYDLEYKEPNQEVDEKMIRSLVLRGHLSMFRHASIYISHLYDNPEYFRAHILNSPYWNHDFSGYASTNFQEAINSKINKEPTITVIGNEEFLEECAKNPELFDLYRMTFCITTQIGTSKDLNRVSPNSIAEKKYKILCI